MAQYRRDVFNLSKGPGLAISDPREDEARALEASRRADMGLALQRQSQAQQALQAQRAMDLQQEQIQTQAALAAQRSQDFARDLAARVSAPINQFPAMGRDSMNRQTNNLRAQQTKLGQDPFGRLGDTGNNFSVGAPVRGGAMPGPAIPVGTANQTRGTGVQAAGFENQSGAGLFGDLSAEHLLGARNQVNAETLQGAQIKDALARTGILQTEAKTRMNDTFADNLREDRKLKHLMATDTETLAQRKAEAQVQAEHNAKILGLEDRKVGVMEGEFAERKDENARLRREREEAVDLATRTQALQFIQQDENLKRMLTDGGVTEESRATLAALGRTNPKLAKAVVAIATDPEVISRIRENADSLFRHRTWNMFGMDSDMKNRDEAERHYRRTISRTGVDPGPWVPDKAAPSPRQQNEFSRLLLEAEENKKVQDEFEAMRARRGGGVKLQGR